MLGRSLMGLKRRLMIGFDEQIVDLIRALEGIETPALEGDEYTSRHTLFETASAQRDMIRDRIATAFHEKIGLFPAPLKVLSVGCGDGVLDQAILSAFPAEAIEYTGIDPNPAQLAACNDLLGHERPVQLYAMPLETEVPGAPFDVSYAVHVIYYADDKVAFVKSMQAATRRDGVCLIAIAPFSRMNEIANVFWKRQDTDAIFSHDLEALFESLGIVFATDRIDAVMPLDLFVGPNRDQEIVEFTVQAHLDHLDANAWAQLDETFRQAARRTGGQLVMDHPVDLYWFAAQ